MFRLIFLPFLLLGFALAARSESPSRGKPQASPSEVGRLIKQLGSNSFEEREAASKVLAMNSRR
jgi:hypothetical protein